MNSPDQQVRSQRSTVTKNVMVAAGAVLAIAVAAIVSMRATGLSSFEHRVANIEQREERRRAEMPEIVRLAGTPGQHLLVDAVADCVTTQRVGQLGDGGKWLCNSYQLAPPCVVYGVGAGTEITFEEEMAKTYGCDVHVFDPTPSSIQLFGHLEAGEARGAGRITFHPWGLGPVSPDPAHARDLTIEGVPCVVKTLDEIATLLGHTRIDVLKMDVEGGEFPILEDLLKRLLLDRYRVDQLMVEFHTVEPIQFVAFVHLIDGLDSAGYLLHRKEINAYVAATCAEYAFARREFLLD